MDSEHQSCHEFEESLVTSLVTSFQIFQDLYGISHSLHFLGVGRRI